jgi:hypothetical protein
MLYTLIILCLQYFHIVYALILNLEKKTSVYEAGVGKQLYCVGLKYQKPENIGFMLGK